MYGVPRVGEDVDEGGAEPFRIGGDARQCRVELERNLIEIVHSPSQISAADLEQIRRRIDAASLLFKVRVMSDELRQREGARDRSTPRVSTSTRITS